MSDKDTQKTYRRKTTRFVYGAFTGAATITIADVAAAWELGDARPAAWFIALTAAALVGWMAVCTSIIVSCLQKVVGRATKALKASLRAELHADLEKAARAREAAQWQAALQAIEESESNVRRFGRG